VTVAATSSPPGVSLGVNRRQLLELPCSPEPRLLALSPRGGHSCRPLESTQLAELANSITTDLFGATSAVHGQDVIGTTNSALSCAPLTATAHGYRTGRKAGNERGGASGLLVPIQQPGKRAKYLDVARRSADFILKRTFRRPDLCPPRFLAKGNR